MAHISSFRTGTLLLLFPLLTLLASTARANVYKLGDVWVDVNTSNLTATVVADPNGTKYSGNITILPFFDVGNYHYVVNSIGSRAFYNCTGLTSVTLPSALTSIAGSAFYGCSGLSSLTIPSSVTCIGEAAFIECTGLTKVVIAGNLTKINANTFKKCRKLSSINIPNSVTSIGEDAFSECRELASLTIPSSVTSIGNNAFYNCTSLASVTIPNSVTSLGDYAFQGCESLQSVTLSSQLTTIGRSTFSSCTNLNSIVIPDKVTNIGWYAFDSCSGLTSVTIGSGVITFGNDAFYDCTSLRTVTLKGENFIGRPRASEESLKTIFGNQVRTYNIPDATQIGSCAFYGCTGITSVSIGSNLQSIKTMAFLGCTGLTEIALPSSLTEIGTYAFYGCTDLKEVNIPSNVEQLSASANIFTNCPNLTKVILQSNAVVSAKREPNASLKTIFGDQVQTYIITGKVKTIAEYAFSQCDKMCSVEFNTNLDNIASHAFSGCTDLTEVTLRNNIGEIANNAFENCTSFHTVNVKGMSFLGRDRNPEESMKSFFGNEIWTYNVEGATQIGEYTFYDCTGITSVNFTDGSLHKISPYAFSGCTGLNQITLPNYVTDINPYAFSDCTNLNQITLPNYRTYIDSCAFFGCTGLTEVTIPSDVKSLGKDAFGNCPNLKIVTLNSNDVVSLDRKEATSMKSIFGAQVKKYILGDDVKSIGDYAFSGCTGLYDMLINATRIGVFAFKGCSGMEWVYLNKGVQSIASQAFKDCDKLLNVSLNCNEPLTGLVIPMHYIFGDQVQVYHIGHHVTSIGSSAFRVCTEMKGIDMGYVESIGTNAFNGCTGLTSIHIPCKSINSNAFEGCTALTSVTFENSLTSIKSKAFVGCTGLERIYCFAKTPPDAEEDAFEGVETNNVLLFVQYGSEDLYKAHDVWKRFWVETPTAISLTPALSEDEGQIYDLSGKRHAGMRRGINIVKQGAKARKVLVR